MSDHADRATWRDWLVVGACLVCQIGMGIGGYIFPVFLKPVASELEWSRTTYALASPIMSTSVALVGPLVGWLSDRRGPRIVLVAGSLLMSLALVGAGSIQSPFDFYLVGIAIGIGVACLGDLPTAAAIAGRFRERRGLALGTVYIGSNVGGALGPLLATALAGGASWRVGFTALGSVLWLFLLPAALLVSRSATANADEPQAARPTEPEESVADVDARGAVRTLDFWLLAWVVFVFYVYRLGVNVHLVAFLSDLGYSESFAAGSFSLTVGLGVAGKLLAGSLADRLGARVAVLAVFSLIALASVLLLLPHLWLALGLFLVVHGFSTAAEDVVIPLLVGRRFGSKHLASIYGWLLLALVPGGTVGPVLAGWIFDTLGSYTVVFSMFVLTNISAVIALLAIRKRPPQAGAIGAAA